MGVVYKAIDERLNRTVAIKMLPPQFANDEQHKRRLLKEAQAASALSHGNICTVYEIEESDNNFFVIMEYLAGHTLAEEINRGPLQTEHAVKIAIEIAKALEIAHSHSIVHRDVKPSNIFITEQGHIKVLDFGLAHIVSSLSAPQNSGRN